MEDLQEIIASFGEKEITITVGDIVKTGKEAIVYKAYLNNELTALKVYKDYNTRAFTDNKGYIAGKYIKKPSLRKATMKKTKVGKDFIHEGWVKREYVMLNRLFSKGCSIPKPIASVKTAILMEFIGNEAKTAPKLKDAILNASQAQTTFELIVENMKKFLDVGVVHADLSEFNILWWKEKPYIIDFPQSIDVKENTNAESLLLRDVNNVCKYFSKYIEINETEVYESLKHILDDFVIYGRNPNFN
ncbi:hypothetical protein GYA37_00185 [candidate division WWE3 bacterium]|uniref:non-specific serine/threonine protein kinase n=1 Tax=candidate division WWE3 bacterium TaxID=2053526 RepID=A0A7X9HS95_UNCKA|nr:hypothetical protein [candidate division WWE3 bacterium]